MVFARTLIKGSLFFLDAVLLVRSQRRAVLEDAGRGPLVRRTHPACLTAETNFGFWVRFFFTYYWYCFSATPEYYVLIRIMY